LPKDILKIIKLIEKKTSYNKKIVLNLALNYGSKEEILNACNKVLLKKKEIVSIKNLEDKLYTRNMPDPDIMIRTGGTKRLSNFLLWQLAYAEIFFVNKFWPEFNENDYCKIIKKFYKIKRNFGKV
jgi:undecaprenyl diphosphate synthase